MIQGALRAQGRFRVMDLDGVLRNNERRGEGTA
jgi:hypothetical protein